MKPRFIEYAPHQFFDLNAVVTFYFVFDDNRIGLELSNGDAISICRSDHELTFQTVLDHLGVADHWERGWLNHHRAR